MKASERVQSSKSAISIVLIISIKLATVWWDDKKMMNFQDDQSLAHINISFDQMIPDQPSLISSLKLESWSRVWILKCEIKIN
jgi:hypothetical protein